MTKSAVVVSLDAETDAASRLPAPTDTLLSTFLSEKRIDGQVREQIDALDALDRSALSRVLCAAHPSAAVFLELFRLTKEIAARDGESLASVCDAAISAAGTPQQVAAKDLRRTLRHLRFPETAEIEKRLNALLRLLKEDTGLSLQLPPDLEGDAVSLAIDISSVDQVQILSQKISSLAENPALSEILLILRGQA